MKELPVQISLISYLQISVICSLLMWMPLWFQITCVTSSSEGSYKCYVHNKAGAVWSNQTNLSMASILSQSHVKSLLEQIIINNNNNSNNFGPPLWSSGYRSGSPGSIPGTTRIEKR
jgi:hypothetical protein